MSAGPRDALFALLEDAVHEGVFPGCVALVYQAGAILYDEAHGMFADPAITAVRNEPVARETIYDLASLTKVLCTTSLTALAIAEGRLELDDLVPEPWSRACPGATLIHLLEHSAGLVAHREYFAQVEPFDADAVIDLVCATPPAAAPGELAVYSDLGFIILGAWLERAWERPLDEAFADLVAYRLGLDSHPFPALGFRRLHSATLPSSQIERAIAPTEVYDASLHPDGVPSHFEVRKAVPFAQGAVHDDNAYAMGGVAGHAGLFGTAAATLEVARAWLELHLPGLPRAVRDRFWQPSSVTNSTRRLGFDGPSPDGSGSAGAAVSATAVGHTGYTGTSLWIDPPTRRIYVLVSNRVHPRRTNDAIKTLRPRFHELAAKIY